MAERRTDFAGSCLCGSVRYAVRGAMRPVVFCHCSQCRKSSGHFVAASACNPAHLELTGEEDLRWYGSSASAERGFCARCGSNLFWKPAHGRYISVMAGTLESPTGLEGACHIYLDDRSDYYAVTDALPRHGSDYPDSLADELE